MRFVIQWSVIAVLVILVLQYLYIQWQQIDLVFTPKNWFMLGIAQLIYIIGMGLLPFNSWRLQKWFGYNQSVTTMWRSFYLAQFVKYLPGGIWSIPGRAVMYHQNGVRANDSGVLVILEILGMMVGSSIVGLFSLSIFLPILFDNIVTILTVGMVGFIALVLGLFFTRSRWYPATQHISLGRSLAVCGLYALNWVILGLGFVFIALAFDLQIGSLETVQIIGVHAVAWVVGFLVIFAPGGVGVRDIILAVGLASFLPAPSPVIISLLARIAWTIAEVAGFFILIPLMKRYTEAQEVLS